MKDPQKRRLIDSVGDSPTFIAEGVRVTGDLETPGPLVVCGSVRGDGRITVPVADLALAMLVLKQLPRLRPPPHGCLARRPSHL